jgi:protein N-lysine methyltransferase METTL21D
MLPWLAFEKYAKMFYYLSFLRPPPLSGLPGTAVALTPQVSNDLRTEYFPSAVDIFYHWTDETGSVVLTKSSKLTTWRIENAYKTVSAVPPPIPRGVRETRCVLVLTLVAASSDASTIDLCELTIGNAPLPVFSLPITFYAGNNPVKSPVATKQEAVERVFRISNDLERPLLRIREMTSFDLDKVRNHIR